MATSTEPRTEQRYVDFDEFIDYQLHKTRSNIKVTEVLTALAGAATLVLAYLLVFVVFDHWIVPGGFSFWPRLLMLSAVGLAASGWVIWKVAVPYFRRVNALYAARTLEQADPSLKSNLLNLIDLQGSGRQISPQILSSLEKQTAVTLQRIDVDHAVDHRPLMRLSYALLAVVVISCLYVLFSPKKVSNSVWRALFPAANVSVSTRTEILDVKPGDTEVLAKSPLEVTVDLRGEIPPHVTLLYSTADGKYVDEPVQMRETDDGLRRYRGVITGDNGRGILQELTYRIQAGDAESSVYKVTVLQPPSATVEEVGYVYPEYMELEPKTQPGAHIDAWDGTTVTVTATSNMPVTSAWVVLSDDPDPHGSAEEIPMTVEGGTKLSAEWKLAIRPNGTYPHFYHIQCRNEKGDRDPDPTVHNVTIRPDKPPEVELLDPTGDLELPANAIVPLSIVARDPDFRLRYLTLRIEQGGEELRPEEIYEGRRKSLALTYEWRLESLRLQPGDLITYWIEARDNKQPLGNRKTTPKLNIRITEPVSEEEVQEQLATDKQRQQELLEEARQDDNEDGTPAGEAPDSGDDEPQPEQPADASEPNQAGDHPEQNTGDPQPGQAGQQGDAAEPQAGGESGEGTEKRQQRLNPDDDADDADVLRKLYERIEEEQRRQEQQDQQSGEQPGDERQPSDDGPQGRDSRDASQPDDAMKPDRNASQSDDQSRDDGQTPRGDQDPQPGSPDQPQPGQPMQEGADPQSNDRSQPDGSGEKQPGTPDQGASGESDDPNQSDQTEPGDMGKGKPDQSGEKADQPSPRSPGDEGDRDPKPADDAKSGEKPQDSSAPMDGEKRPADPSDDGVKQKADGDESGVGRPEDDPNADPTRSKNEIEREKGTDPATKPSDQPEDADPQDRQPSEGGGKDPKQAEPAPKTQPDSKPQAADQQDPSMPPDATQERPAAKTDGQTEGANEDLKGDGPQEGQRSDQPDGGEQGMGQKNDQGTPGSNESGKGDTGSQPGDADPGQPEPGGKPGDEQGRGTQSDGDKPGGDDKTGGTEGASESGEKSDGAQQDGGGRDGGQSGEMGDQPGDSKADGASSGQTGEQGGGATRGGEQQAADAADGADSGGEGGGAADAEASNPDHAKQAADLVLKRLQNELDRGEVDQELLDELGWSENDMKRFAERLQRQLQESSAQDESPESIARRRQFEETLKNLNLESQGNVRRDSQAPKRSIDSIGPRNLPTPAEYREAAEAYLRSLSKEGSERQSP